jgi:hypothetical protein
MSMPIMRSLSRKWESNQKLFIAQIRLFRRRGTIQQSQARSIPILQVRPIASAQGTRVARFFLAQHTKTGKPYQNDHKIDKMAIKLNNIFHCKTLQNLPKLAFLVWKHRYHLATLRFDNFGWLNFKTLKYSKLHIIQKFYLYGSRCGSAVEWWEK